MHFKRILVANRGEIAVRIMQTCRLHGIETVAVCSDVDRNAAHVVAADFAIEIGSAPAADSYLNVERIIQAAKRSGADAIHPGYGFLSEQGRLAEACEAAQMTWIGPPVLAMEIMGDKVRSRIKMREAGVPVVPGEDELENVEAARTIANKIGFPLMLKASAGGGGKGMRIVHDMPELERGFESASREAKAAFGDDRIFVERAVMNARHVEIQVMADNYGEVRFLHERDCSVQRRHQKVIEEAPCPSIVMSEALRNEMGKIACRAAASVNYRGAGTVEFLFEETKEGGRFYFLEMNTRLQVEHPVTECITGRDLVWDQICIAAGKKLDYRQEDIPLWGHAIECRVYAEDPIRFLPCPGKIHHLRWPNLPYVRVDAGVIEGGEVSSYYDPMIAKIVVWGASRKEAIARMSVALEQTQILGIQTNLDFHRRVLREPDFQSGSFSTRYIEEHPQLIKITDVDSNSDTAREEDSREQLSKMIAAASAVQAERALRNRSHLNPRSKAILSNWQRAMHPGQRS